jgi:hypothetical protein
MLPPTDAGGPDPVADLNPDGGLKPTSSRDGSPWPGTLVTARPDQLASMPGSATP